MMLKKRYTLPFLLVTLPVAAFAEPNKPGTVGRYQDGRAYRVDSQGLQLADQIAELEMTIREQEAQLVACEERANGGAAPRQNCAIPAPATAATCESFTKPIQGKLTQLQAQSAELQAEIAKLKTQLAAAPTDRDIESAALAERAKTSTVESRLNQLESERKAQTSELMAQIASLKEKLSQTESDLQKRSEREQELLSQLDERDSSTQARQRTTQGTNHQARAMLASEPKRNNAEIADAKKSVAAELATIQQLIAKRKDLSDSLRTSHKGIVAALQPLQTSRGVSLDQIRAQVQKLETPEQASVARAGLGEIRAILTSDIELYQRLLKHL